MIFSIIVILLVGVIAYFHYLQGFFSATLSATFAMIAAAVAIGYHETVISSLLGGKYADQSTAIVLCAMFGGVYLILRLVADSFVFGNVRLPSTIDKVGGGILGSLVGLLAVGIVVLAAESLPYGPVLAGYARLNTIDARDVVIPPKPGKMQARDSKVYDELKNDDMSGAQNTLVVPADNFVVATVSMLSEGSLEGSQKLKSIHPDWSLELFGQRLGVQPGAKRVAINSATSRQMTVDSTVVVLPSVNERDDESSGLRQLTLGKPFKPAAGHGLAVIVAKLTKDFGEVKDSIARFSTGGARLVINGKNYFAIGTLESNGTLDVNRPDDYLFADLSKSDATVAFVFDVDMTDLTLSGKAVRDGAFFELKRFAREDLSGLEVRETSTLKVTDGVMRKNPETPPVSKPQS